MSQTKVVANLGHEIRTPMTGVLGMTELLLSSPLDTRQRSQAESIRSAGEHLLLLVNDALDLARIESGRLELLTVCAGAVLAAHAGLLDGRRATTHHHHLDELQAVAPRCEVVSNRVFVLDGAVSSSAGVTTGIDLFLHHIAAVCGPAIAAQVTEIWRSPPIPESGIVLRGDMDPALKEKIRSFFLTYGQGEGPEAERQRKVGELVLSREPLTGLDRTTAEELVRTLKIVTRGRTTLLIAHDPISLQLADRVVHLKNRKFLEDGFPPLTLERKA